MAPYDGSLDDKEQNRRDAERETEIAREREALQKKEKDELHKKNVAQKVRDHEESIRKIKHAIAALELEEGRLDQVAAEGRRSNGTKRSGTLKLLLRNLKEKLTQVKQKEERTESEQREHEHALTRGTRTVAETSREREHIETERREEMHDADELKAKITALQTEYRTLVREIEGNDRKLKELSSGGAVSPNDVREEERIMHELKNTEASLQIEERKLGDEVRKLEEELRVAERDESERDDAANLGRSATLRLREHAREKDKREAELATLERELNQLKREL